MKFKPACLPLCLAIVLLLSFSGCAVETSKAETSAPVSRDSVKAEAAPATNGATIEIVAGSPSDTVRAFYAKLRERKIREAIFLTNLRPAIEALTDDELKEFAVDFDNVAKNVPANIEINGEIISGADATVTAKLPDEDDKRSLQQIRLRKEGEFWIILSADPVTELRIKKEGKNYFHVLKIETLEAEAKSMLDRIAKAQMVHALQNNGDFAEFGKLIGQGLLPSDVMTSETTGYNYKLNLAVNRKQYSVSATPAVYGKTGKTSYWLDLNKEGKPQVKSEDRGGKPFEK